MFDQDRQQNRCRQTREDVGANSPHVAGCTSARACRAAQLRQPSPGTREASESRPASAAKGHPGAASGGSSGAGKTGHTISVESALVNLDVLATDEDVTWSSENVLKVPLSGVFRRGEGWSAFVIAVGRAMTKSVEIGHRNESDVEILSGLVEGDRVILHPPNELTDGMRVRAE